PQWIHDYNQTATLGEVDSTVRTPAQTEIGLFWTEHTPQQYARAFGYLAKNYQQDIMDSARLLAILWTGFANSEIGCFKAKHTSRSWRPARPARGGRGCL